MIAIGSVPRTFVALALGATVLSGCTQPDPTPAGSSSPALPSGARQVGSCLELSRAAQPDAVHLTLPQGFGPAGFDSQRGVFMLKDQGADTQQAVAIYEPPISKRSDSDRVLDAWAQFSNHFGTVTRPGAPTPWPNVAGASTVTSSATINPELPPSRVDWFVVPTADTAFVVVTAGPTTDQALAAVGPSVATGPCPG